MSGRAATQPAAASRPIWSRPSYGPPRRTRRASYRDADGDALAFADGDAVAFPDGGRVVFAGGGVLALAARCAWSSAFFIAPMSLA